MGSKYRSHYVSFMNVRLGDSGNHLLETGNKADIVDEAVSHYSKYFPDTETVDITGDGTATYVLPTNWVQGFSQALQLEFPQGYQNPAYMKSYRLMEYYDVTAAAWKLRFIDITPSSSQKLRLQFSKPHSVTDVASTIPDSNFTAVASLAVSKAALALAGRSLSQQDSRIEADVFHFRTVASQYQSFAKVMFEEHFCKALGINPDRDGYATAIFDIEHRLTGGWLPIARGRQSYSRGS